ncbi:uncharacterized protein LOC115460579 [Microcaecilia unicolor]|uniref:Uncharacterized protein LOC115460579 n=1 Tax=Microcaecilia unicolor TaxID=1415580 RepID=A0A6P7WSQ0_9AMPH|nr:uncharacterized protein LOC115460579 [Microcaecilia unicolor]
MPCCAASGCKERRYHDRITFHRFPSDPVLRQRWLTEIRRENFVPSKFTVLCSKHFREEDMDRTSMSIVRLRVGAVPSIFDFPSHLCRVKKTQKSPKARSSNAPLIPNPDNKICSPLPEPASTKIGLLNNPDTSPSSNTQSIPNPDNKIHLPLLEPATTETGMLNIPDIPEKLAVQRKLEHAQSQLSISRKKIKLLLQTKRRLQKKVDHLNSVISDHKKCDMLSRDSLQIHDNCCTIGNFLKRQIAGVSLSPVERAMPPQAGRETPLVSPEVSDQSGLQSVQGGSPQERRTGADSLGESDLTTTHVVLAKTVSILEQAVKAPQPDILLGKIVKPAVVTLESLWDLTFTTQSALQTLISQNTETIRVLSETALNQFQINDSQALEVKRLTERTTKLELFEQILRLH